MFALSHQEPRPRSSAAPAAELSVRRARPVELWAVRSASLALALGIAAASVLVGSHVVFGQGPIGGTSGLLALYGATAGVGIGLAVFFQLMAFANRLAESLTPPPAKVISMPAPAARATEATDAEWTSRPFNAA